MDDKLKALKEKHPNLSELVLGIKRMGGGVVYDVFPNLKALENAKQFGWERFWLPEEPVEAKPAKAEALEVPETPVEPTLNTQNPDEDAEEDVPEEKGGKEEATASEGTAEETVEVVEKPRKRKGRRRNRTA